MSKKILCVLVVLFSFSSYANSELERVVQAQGELLTDYQQKITNLQYEVDQLRGQAEETSYQLNKTIERQKDIIQQLNHQENSIKNQVQTTPTLVGWSSSGDDKQDYNLIIKFVLEGKESKESILAFQQFLKDYPESSYLFNVNYWLGQLCYGEGRKDDASFYYATVVKNFPKSAKAADSLYKVGIILFDKGEMVKAKAVFQQVVEQYSDNKNVVSKAREKLKEMS